MQTILKCSNCNQGLAVITEPKGQKKDGSPTKKMISVLICKNCGKRYDGAPETKQKENELEKSAEE